MRSVAIVRVGEAPVGLMAVHGGLIVVADSNRFGAAGAIADLDVVSVADALDGHPAVLGHVASGRFPREMAVPPGDDGTLLVSTSARASSRRSTSRRFRAAEGISIGAAVNDAVGRRR